MSKKAKRFVPSDSEDSDFSSSEDSSSSDEDETVEVNGFKVLVSQENQVRELLKKHPDLTSDFKLKNKLLKNANINVILDLIQTLCQSTNEISNGDLNKVDSTLFDLTRAGLKVGWLHQKLDEAYSKKEKQRVSGARIRELEQHVKKRKLTLSNLESDLKKEKFAALAAKTQFRFSDFFKRNKSPDDEFRSSFLIIICCLSILAYPCW